MARLQKATARKQQMNIKKLVKGPIVVFVFDLADLNGKRVKKRGGVNVCL